MSVTVCACVHAYMYAVFHWSAKNGSESDLDVLLQIVCVP